MVSSMSIITNQIKLHMEYPLKNIVTARNVKFKTLVLMLVELIIPQYFLKNIHDFKKVNQMHNLLRCLNQKVAQVF